jgi:SAM-dependent methyltransferase
MELAWQWEERNGRLDPLRFYRDSELYLYDLTLYHDLMLAPRGTHTWFTNMVRDCGFRKVLDFGGGNGDWTLLAARAGATDVAYLDVDGVMSDFAKWRFDKHNICPKILTENATLDEYYDAIVCMDVFEHMEDPAPTIATLAKKTPYIFCNPEEIPYNWIYPQHISRFDLSGHFTRMQKYLWKSNLCAP